MMRVCVCARARVREARQGRMRAREDDARDRWGGARAVDRGTTIAGASAGTRARDWCAMRTRPLTRYNVLYMCAAR